VLRNAANNVFMDYLKYGEVPSLPTLIVAWTDTEYWYCFWYWM